MHGNSEAKSESDRLRNVLGSQPPWSKEVELHRQQSVFASCNQTHPANMHALEDVVTPISRSSSPTHSHRIRNPSTRCGFTPHMSLSRLTATSSPG